MVSLRLVDARGRVRVVRRGEALFPAVLVSMGLCGVITEVTLACEPRYDVAGEEWWWMDERLVPTSFTELWLPLGAAGEIMRRLDALYRTDPVAAGHFATELYAAPASEAWLSPAYGRESLRINPFWFDRNPGDPRHAVFPRLWATLADLGYRLYWGKALPQDTAASARHLSRQYQPRGRGPGRLRQPRGRAGCVRARPRAVPRRRGEHRRPP